MNKVLYGLRAEIGVLAFGGEVVGKLSFLGISAAKIAS